MMTRTTALVLLKRGDEILLGLKKRGFGNERLIDDIDDKDVGLASKRREAGKDYSIKLGARAILLNDKGQIALIHSTNRGWYKLPGGGREKGELARENLERELIEETGYNVKVLQNLGICRNVRHDWKMVAEAQIYLCQTTEFVGSQQMEDEKEDGDVLEWFDDFDAAISALKAVKLEKIDYYGAYFFTRREIDALEYAKKVYEK